MTTSATPHADQAEADSLQPIHPAPTSFLRSYVFSTDHKVIAKQFLWAGLLFLLFGGLLAMLIRWQWAYPGQPVPLVGKLLFRRSGGVITPAAYNAIFTMHGLIMIFFAITPHADRRVRQLLHPADDRRAGHGVPAPEHAVVLDLRRLAGPGRRRRSSSQLGSAAAGWTTYPPLSTKVGTPGRGPDAGGRGASSSPARRPSWARINYVTTVIRFRAPGMGYMRMPLTVWGLWLTVDPQRAVRAGAGRGHAAAAPRPRVRHPVLHRRRRGGARRRRSRSCSSTCSGSSATRRSTS